MIPHKNQTCFYKGNRVTVVGVDVSSFPTAYIIQWDEQGVIKQAKVDDLSSFTAAPPLPDTMSDMEGLADRVRELEEENAHLINRNIDIQDRLDDYISRDPEL